MRRSNATSFFDEDGVRWTVVPVRAGRVLGAGPVALEFTSEHGERRVATHPHDGVAWRRVDDVAWRSLLRHSTLVT